MLDLVGAGQVDRGVVGDARADRVPGAAIDDVVVADRQDAALVVEADLDIVQLVARMRRGHEMLAPLLDPAHRPAEAAREERDQEILGVGVALAAEPAADIERDDAHALLGEAEGRGDLAAHPMHDLGRGPARHRPGARIVGADDAAAFQRHRGIAMVVEAALQAVRRGGEHRLGVALADRERADQVGVEALVDERRAGAQRRFRVDDRRQLVEIEGHQFGGVLGLIAGLGDDDRDRFADMAHLVVRRAAAGAG